MIVYQGLQTGFPQKSPLSSEWSDWMSEEDIIPVSVNMVLDELPSIGNIPDLGRKEVCH